MKKIRALVELVVELNMRTIENMKNSESEYLHGFADGVTRVLTDLNKVVELIDENN